MKKETLVQVIIIIILTIILSGLIFITAKEMNSRDNKMFGMNPMEEEVEKETKKEDVDSGNKVEANNINLNEHTTNINISNGGEYNISGEFKNSIIVDSTDKVILNLNNVTIDSQITAAIANKNSGELVINLVENTTNILKDNGSSEYDGCIYSEGNLTIEGSGTLKVYGRQAEGEGIATETKDITINGGDIYIESADDGLNAGGDGGIITINNGSIVIKASGDGIDSNKDLIINGGTIYTMGSSIGGDAGIDTDGKFEINGGEVIALGSDMLQNPDNESKQKSVSFTLNSKILSGSKISLKDANGNEIISFEAKEDFKTLIISNSDLTSEKYYLYINGEKTEYSKEIK
ncbi:MAG: carbohydrate-binding domain-containing protein [Clostridia bacterium]|nr:carbohydrate-binding domain-containing protein [Clostridia bacterium]